MDERIQQLYQSVILQHQKQPYHFEKRTNATHQIEAYNPFCGDQFTLYFDLVNNQLENLYFHGFGCAISKAATSVLVEQLQGKTQSEAVALIELYLKHLDGTNPEADVPIKDFEAFEATQLFPERRTCADLSASVLLDFLKQKQ